MSEVPVFGGRPGAESTIVITDSGLGGLLVFAELERRLRAAGAGGAVRLVYVNAWPDARYGYNDLPDIAARATVLDRALAAMTSFLPGLILIACNTLSVVYEATAFSRAPAAPVVGILDEGADLFSEALALDPSGVLVLFGTRTTIGSGEHIRRLARRGIGPQRIFTEACHGLAAAIDKDPASAALPGLVESCVLRVVPRLPAVVPLYVGLACTHYAYVADAFRRSLGNHTGARIDILDPGGRLVDGLMHRLSGLRPESAKGAVMVEVVSKVELPDAQRRAVARRIESVSPGAALALINYRRIPDLF